MKSLGKTIRDRRTELGINQQILADLSSVGINTIVAIERDKGNPSLKTLQRIFDTLGLEFTVQVKRL